MQDMKSDDNFFGQVAQLFRDAKRKMSMSVNMAMVYSYYEAGRMIIDEEQNGSERAAYGKYILQELSRRLTEEFGRGFSLDGVRMNLGGNMEVLYLLELGRGFTFVGRQVRFTFEEEH